MGFFGMFNFDKPGKGIDPDAPEKRGFFLFFDIFIRKFWRIVTLSLSYTLLCVPVFFIYFAMTTFLQNAFSPIKDPQFITYMGTYLTLFLLCFLGAGPASAGQTYVLRNFSRETHAWVWDDFVSHAKENIKQGSLMFLLDLIVIPLLVSAASLYLMHGGTMPLPPVITMAFGFLAVFILFIYLMMHFFVYPLMVTLDMKFGALLKTAMQLTLLKLPQCLLIFVIAGAVFAAFLALYFVNVAFILLFGALGFSLVTFVYVFYAMRVIDEMLEEQNRI